MSHSSECRSCFSINYYNEDDICNNVNVKFECWNCGEIDYLFPEEIFLEKLEDCNFVNTTDNYTYVSDI